MPEQETLPEQETESGPDRSKRDKRDDTRTERGRRKRVPLGASQPKLHATVPDGMVGRWFNDTPGRIQSALDAGYDFINDKGAKDERESARKERVGVNEDGSAMLGYLMAIPKKWYNEDQKVKQKPVNAIDEAIKRGQPVGATAEAETFYDAGSSVKND